MANTVSAIAPIEEVKVDRNRITDPEKYRKEKARLESIHTIKPTMFANKKERSKHGDFTSVKKYIEVNANKFIDEKYVIFAEVYQDYKKWANLKGYVPCSDGKFETGLAEMGYKFFVYYPKTNMPEDFKQKYGNRYRRKIITNFAEMQKESIQVTNEVKKSEIDMNKFKEDVNKFIIEDCKNSDRYTQKLEMFAYFLIKYPMYEDVDIKDFEKIFEKNKYSVGIRITKKNIRVNAINGIIPNYDFFLTIEDSGMIKEYDLSKAKNMKERVKAKKFELIKEFHAKNEEKDNEKEQKVVEEKKEESDNKVIPIKPQKHGGLSEMAKESLKIETPKQNPAISYGNHFGPVGPANPIPVNQSNGDNSIAKKTCEYLLDEANNLSDELNENIEYIRMKSLDDIVHHLRKMDLDDEFLAKMFFKTNVTKHINEIKNAKTSQEITKAFISFVDEKKEIEKYHK